MHQPLNLRDSRCALLIIDMQRDFVLESGSSPVPGTEQIVPKVGRLAAAWRAAKLPIVHVVRFYRRDGSNAEIHRRDAVIARSIVSPNTPGAEIETTLGPPGMPPLDPERLMAGELQSLSDHEWAMYKPRWGAFYRTALESLLAETGSSAIAVCGCNLPNCPRATLFEASERDFAAVLVADATSQSSANRLSDLSLIGVEVRTTGEILAELVRGPTGSPSTI